MPFTPRILLIEDDREIQSTLSGVLRGAGYDVLVASNGIDGQKLIQEERPALVITDMMMPRMGGFPVLDFVNTLAEKPAVIMITANEGGRHKAYAEMLGVIEYLRKPFPMEQLLDTVARVLPAAPPTGTKPPLPDEGEAPLGPLRRAKGRKKGEE
jgi:DNA-binding response OmpR family regulator